MPFTLEKADSQEFARWWAVYRNANEDFSQSFAEQYEEIATVPYCHWIMSGDKRVGGLIHVPNNIGDFFLIHPFDDAFTALKAILPDGKLHARNILDAHVEAFQMLGFTFEESRRWMLRPTQAFNIHFDLRREPPDSSQSNAIAELMFAAFLGGVGQYGARDVETHRKSVENYFETVKSGEICHQASSALFDGERMVAACLVQPYKSLASIRFVITHPEYQRRGLARRLMGYAIDTIKDDFDFVALAVTMGNPAQGLYSEMGFLPGHVMHTLVRSE